MSNTTGQKSAQTKKSTKSSAQVSERKSAAGSRSAAGNKNNGTKSRDKKQRSLLREVIFLLIAAVSVLMFISCFSETLLWLRKICFTLFGNLMYPMPFIIIGVAFLLVFNTFSANMAVRLLGLILVVFSVSGIFSAASVPENGGLLGRGNYALFFKGLGAFGTILVNVFIIIIGLILLTGFSFSEFIQGRREENAKKEEDIERQNQKIRRQKQEEALRHEKLEKQEKELSDVEKMKRENDALASSNNQRARNLKNGERFKPIYGIGDTRITDDTPIPETTFKSTSGVLKENEDLFKGTSEKKTDVSKNLKGNYSNSGSVTNTEDKTARDLSFIPDIKVSNSYFGDDTPGEVSLSMKDEAESSRVRIVRRDAAVKEAEDEAPAYQLDDEDEYVKTVITGSGKIIRAETDGDILSKKPVIHGGSGTLTNDESTDAETEDVPVYGEEKLNTSSAGDKVSKASETENLKTSGEIENSIRKEPDREYVFPPLRLLKKGNSAGISKTALQEELKETAAKLQMTLKTFGVDVTITNITCGPTVTCYEILPAMGVKVSKIVSLTDDIKLNLAARDIRIEAPIPGKSAIGIEIPNKVKQSVVLRDLLESEPWQKATSNLAFAAGRDIEGNTIVSNIEKMPHVLVAGQTGSGKSVCINSMIMSILYHAKPTDVKMILVDPKVVELSVYNGIPHLLLPVVTDPKKAAAALNWAVAEMEKRYQLFATYGVRNMEGFNDMIFQEAPEDEGGNPIKKMPQILIIVDELADLMMVAAGEVETAICRLAQKARAAGIHLVLATQRPSVDVITGLIKANIPSRIAFSVSSGVDSRTILDTVGAEKLLGYGDMLYAPAGASKPTRLQGTFVSDEEVNNVVEYIKKQGEVKGGVNDEVDLNSVSQGASSGASSGDDRDEYFADAGRLVIEKEKASIGMLQRAFKLGFNRAARIVDQLCEAGVVGEEEGTKPRRVLMNTAEFEEYLKNL